MASATPSLWKKFEQRVFGRWLENTRLFGSKRALELEEKSKLFKWWNNALNAAPAFKWALAIVPLYSAVSGRPPVEKLDLKQSVALTATGAVWSYYAMLVEPRAWLLLYVNIALLSANGWNVYRKVKFDQNHKLASNQGKTDTKQ